MNQLIIFMEGGLITHIETTLPAQVTVVDWDTEGGDPNQMKEMPSFKSVAYIGNPTVECNPTSVNETLTEIANAQAPTDN